MTYRPSWHVIGPTKNHPRELVLIDGGTTIKRETTKLGPRAAYQECQRRNAETTTTTPTEGS